MRIKPNFLNAEMNVSSVNTMNYELRTMNYFMKNKANQTQTFSSGSWLSPFFPKTYLFFAIFHHFSHFFTLFYHFFLTHFAQTTQLAKQTLIFSPKTTLVPLNFPHFSPFSPIFHAFRLKSVSLGKLAEQCQRCRFGDFHIYELPRRLLRPVKNNYPVRSGPADQLWPIFPVFNA